MIAGDESPLAEWDMLRTIAFRSLSRINVAAISLLRVKVAVGSHFQKPHRGKIKIATSCPKWRITDDEPLLR
jgi:hypothetical protein